MLTTTGDTISTITQAAPTAVSTPQATVTLITVTNTMEAIFLTTITAIIITTTAITIRNRTATTTTTTVPTHNMGTVAHRAGQQMDSEEEVVGKLFRFVKLYRYPSIRFGVAGSIFETQSPTNLLKLTPI